MYYISIIETMAWFYSRKEEIDKESVKELVIQAGEESLKRICKNPRKVLLLPPDITRAHSGAGWITNLVWGAILPNSTGH